MSEKSTQISIKRYRIVRFVDVRGTSGPQLPDPGSKAHAMPTGKVCYRTARSRSDFVGAFEVLQRRYAASGLSPRRNQALRVLPYHLWDETQVFVAAQDENVVGSVSLIRDGNPKGLPMESTYGHTIRGIRGKGFRLGEVCALTADSPGDLSTGELFGQLTRLMMFHARHVGLDYLVAVVHPRHAKFYQRAMGFEKIGGVSLYQQVGGQPGIPILGRVNDRSSYRPRWQKYYFDGTYAPEDLAPRPMSKADRLYFQQFIQPSDVSSFARVA